VLAKTPRAEVERRIERLVAPFQPTFDLNRHPYELSGGQQQLVSIMRALAPEPEVLRFDAPRPRDISALSVAGFVRAKAHALRVYQREVRKGEGAP
jgi:ABC-type sugar transport system ATPase subunit